MTSGTIVCLISQDLADINSGNIVLNIVHDDFHV